MAEIIDRCYGCMYDEPCIENTLRYCSHCKRGTGDEEAQKYLEDLYKNRHVEKRTDNDKLFD